MSKHKVFVYGSLKRGHGNNGIISSRSGRFVGYDTITGSIEMVSLGGFPGVIDDKLRVKGVNTVFGELWEVSGETLEALDVLEGRPHFYDRELYTTDELDEDAWVYTLTNNYLYANTGTYPVVGGQDKPRCWHPKSEEVRYWKEEHGIDVAA